VVSKSIEGNKKCFKQGEGGTLDEARLFYTKSRGWQEQILFFTGSFLKFGLGNLRKLPTKPKECFQSGGNTQSSSKSDHKCNIK
jgi:hypothetical protein